MEVSTIGLDIAKNTFYLSGIDGRGKEVARKRLTRSKVLAYFAQLKPCLVGIEACSGAHYWAREFERLGHTVKLMSPKAVKAYRSKTKNDYNDARAIAEAATREQVRALPVKTPEQLDMQMMHSAREQVKKQRNQVANAIRGHLAERGVVLERSVKALRRRVPELLEDAENGLSGVYREVLNDLYETLCWLDTRLGEYDARCARAQAHDDIARHLATVPGVGVLTSTAIPALHGDLRQFGCGRDFASALGLVPRQNSTGGRTVLLGINKHTNPYLRTLLIHGARSVLNHAEKHLDDALCQWALRVRERRGFNIACVALANKLARIVWAVMVHGEQYNPRRLRGRGRCSAGVGDEPTGGLPTP